MGTIYHPNSDDNILRAHIFEALDKALADYPNSAIFFAGDFKKFSPGNLCSSFKLKQLIDQIKIIFWIKFIHPFKHFMTRLKFLLQWECRIIQVFFCARTFQSYQLLKIQFPRN